ncbi:DNA repair helicase [Blastomyces gilchristii SLH14081]|uniref:DNA repair helicase n=1 Tax=Blastomyces gilchristii (strain SLH14081) TaxID=559298 RepID=A0A179UBE7_BLAGS|nr:DNA repair helicase [Blastomyces gilchristii SLH14081]OAT04599.1 DNA repair helicase [Blastomyces gilchristii SLH14081]
MAGDNLLHTGQMPLRARDKHIRTFSKDPAARILICSLRTAGIGVDLTATNKCILVDLWWNEAMEQQAFSRIFRIRQQRNVEFVRIVVQNSIDDRIQLIQNEKTDGIEQVIGSEVLTSRDTLANLCTVLGIEQDDSMERGYRFISDKEAERRHEAAPVTVFDGETGKAPGQAEADTCASAASNINGLADSRSNPPGVGNVKDTESTESSADKVGDVGTINDGETCEIASIGGGTLAKGTKSVIANGTGEPVGPSQATREVGSDVSRDL